MESEGKKENKKSKKEISELEIIERDLITKFRKDSITFKFKILVC